MGFISELFGPRPYPAHAKQEVDRLVSELVRIGETEDFLSERPGPPFNFQCRHIRTREIGKRLNELGGLRLMEFVHKKVKKRLGKILGSHLEYAWSEIGNWIS